MDGLMSLSWIGGLEIAAVMLMAFRYEINNKIGPFD